MFFVSFHSRFVGESEIIANRKGDGDSTGNGKCKTTGAVAFVAVDPGWLIDAVASQHFRNRYIYINMREW